MTSPDWRDEAWKHCESILREILDKTYAETLAPALTEAGLDPARYRLEFAPMGDVVIIDDPHPSVPAEVTVDIAADTETSGCKCEQQTVGIVINNQIMCGTCGRNTNLRIPDDCAWCSTENYSRAVNCMGPAKAAAAFTRHVIRGHHPQLGTPQ